MGFLYMCQRIPEDVQVIIAGIVSPKRMQSIKRAAGKRKLSVLNQTAYLQSRRGISSESGGRAEKSLDKNVLFKKNMEYYKHEYEKMHKSEDKQWGEIDVLGIQ